MPYRNDVPINADGLKEAMSLINDAIPTKTSDLMNDSGFITATDIPDTIDYQTIPNTSSARYISGNADLNLVGIGSEYEWKVSVFTLASGNTGFKHRPDTLLSGVASILINYRISANRCKQIIYSFSKSDTRVYHRTQAGAGDAGWSDWYYYNQTKVDTVNE